MSNHNTSTTTTTSSSATTSHIVNIASPSSAPRPPLVTTIRFTVPMETFMSRGINPKQIMRQYEQHLNRQQHEERMFSEEDEEEEEQEEEQSRLAMLLQIMEKGEHRPHGDLNETVVRLRGKMGAVGNGGSDGVECYEEYMQDMDLEESQEQEEIFLRGVMQYHARKNMKKHQDDGDEDDEDTFSDSSDLDLADDLATASDRKEQGKRAQLQMQSALAGGGESRRNDGIVDDDDDDGVVFEYSEEMETYLKELEDKINSLDRTAIDINMISREYEPELLKVALQSLREFKRTIPKGLVKRLHKLPNLEKFKEKTIKSRMRLLITEHELDDAKTDLEEKTQKLREAVRTDMERAWDRREERLRKDQLKKKQDTSSSTSPRHSKDEESGEELSVKEEKLLMERFHVDQEYIDLLNKIKKGRGKVTWSKDTERAILDMKKRTVRWLNDRNKVLRMRKMAKDQQLDVDKEMRNIVRSWRPLWPNKIDLHEKIKQIENANKRKKLESSSDASRENNPVAKKPKKDGNSSEKSQ